MCKLAMCSGVMPAPWLLYVTFCFVTMSRMYSGMAVNSRLLSAGACSTSGSEKLRLSKPVSSTVVSFAPSASSSSNCVSRV